MRRFETVSRKVWLWLLGASLWLSGISLSVFSAGLDGEFLAGLLPWRWTGYALNFSGDLAGEVLMYQFARIQKEERHGTKKWRLSWMVLAGSVLSLLYSWFFSWLQLEVVMAGRPPWVPVISAAFVPILLGCIGYTQAIVESKLERVDKGEQLDVEKAVQARLTEYRTKLRQEFADEMAAQRVVPEWSVYQVLMRDGWQCFYCGADMRGWEPGQMHIDHFYPRSKGGGDELDNLVVSCAQCNLSKNNREPTPDEVARFQAHLVKHAQLETSDKVVLLDRMGLLEQQKDIADQVGVSASYVSSLLRKAKGQLSVEAERAMAQLAKVGRPGDNGNTSGRTATTGNG